MSLEEALLSIWRQVLVDRVKNVVIDGHSFPVVQTSRSRLRQVDFTFQEDGFRGLEQNPATNSRWARLAREGQNVMQFLKGGHYVAVIADGNLFTYGHQHD